MALDRDTTTTAAGAIAGGGFIIRALTSSVPWEDPGFWAQVIGGIAVIILGKFANRKDRDEDERDRIDPGSTYRREEYNKYLEWSKQKEDQEVRDRVNKRIEEMDLPPSSPASPSKTKE